METKTVKVTISGKDYPLDFSIKAWKDLKANADVTLENVDEKVKEDTGILGVIVFYAIPENERKDLTLETVEKDLHFDVMEKVETAILNTFSPESRKKALEAKKVLNSIGDEAIKKLTEQGKKK